MSDTCSLFPPFGDPWPSCLLPSHYLQGIFPTQGSNLGFLPCKYILYHLSHERSPMTSLVLSKWAPGPVHQGTAVSLDLPVQSEKMSYWSRFLLWKQPLYVVSKQKWYKWANLQIRKSHIHRDELMVFRGKDGGKGLLGSWQWACMHSHI